MPYSQYTLNSLSVQISTVLDDFDQRYWTEQEIHYAIWEGLRVWGALTNYWRQRGAFTISAGQPYYDLSEQLPALRSRNTTLDSVDKDIQLMLLESGFDIGGSGMSGQTTPAAILYAIQQARNRFVKDAIFPFSLPQIQPVTETDGQITLPEDCIYTHRVAWQDLTSGTWGNLWQEDIWSADHNMQLWTQGPGTPQSYSESEFAPLILQLYPAPAAIGNIETLNVKSLQVNLGDPAATFDIPDEWMHAVKYAALAELLSADSQLNDPLRAQYAQMRYDQAVEAAKLGRSVMRLTLNGIPLPIDSFAALDAARPTWRNQTDRPDTAGVLYDMLAFAPVPDQDYGVTADVVRSAPLPVQETDPIQLGPEDIQHLIDYCLHVLMFKCGGNEFKATFPEYDSFMKAAAMRGKINEAKIKYLTPLFGQPQKDQQENPDRMEGAGAGVKSA